MERLERHLSVISRYTSLAVNYTKSKVAWIGKDRFRRDTQGPYEWIDLNKSSIKILGIHFTYDKVLSKKLNFDQVFFKVKNTLNLWKTRWFTIYGKVTVIRTLVLSLILYVCNMQSPPSSFLSNVQKELMNFLLSDGSPKIQFKSLISDYEEGGIKLPDVHQNHLTLVLGYLHQFGHPLPSAKLHLTLNQGYLWSNVGKKMYYQLDCHHCYAQKPHFLTMYPAYHN